MDTKKYRENLIFVAGATPQIITETLYGLIRQKKPPVWPDEIFVLTTLTGKEKIQQELTRKGRLQAFSREFGLKQIPLGEEAIIVLTDLQGNPLEDIRGAEHNEAVGDLIANFIRKKAGDPASRLHCSLNKRRLQISIRAFFSSSHFRYHDSLAFIIDPIDNPVVADAEAIKKFVTL